MPYYKDTAALRTAPLVPRAPIADVDRLSRDHRGLALIFNRLGGLIEALAVEIGADTPAILGVLMGEGFNEPFKPGRARIELDCVELKNHLQGVEWSEYEKHFAESPHPWETNKQRFRRNANEEFKAVHESQDTEYEALDIAVKIAGVGAFSAIKYGPKYAPRHLLGIHFRTVGYYSASEMFEALQSDERWHVLALFDWCRESGNPRGAAIQMLRDHRWREFARHRFGTDFMDWRIQRGNEVADGYGRSYEAYYERARQLLP